MSTSMSSTRSRSRTARPGAAGRVVTLRRRRRVPVVLVVALAVLVVLGGGGWLVGFSSVLDARSVQVVFSRPPGYLSAAAVRQAAAVPLGGPLARLDTGPVASRVAALPAVDRVEVSRVYPHEVKVTVTERKPVAVLQTGSRLTVVDADGVAFATVSKAPKGVVRITGTKSERAVLRPVAAVLTSLPASLAHRVSSASGPSANSITLSLDGGVKLIWGDESDSQLKIQVAQVLLRQKGVKVVDVSAPGMPVTR